MKKNIDQQFVLKIMALTQQLLVDKAKPDAEFDFLDNFLSQNPASEQRELNWQKLEQHYFIEQGKKLGTGAVPFSAETEEDRQDRKFYIDELYKIFKNQTYNFTQTQLYYPTKVKSKSGEENFVFTGEQMERIYRLSFRISYGFEQQHLGATSKQSGTINLGEKDGSTDKAWQSSMLVQSRDGFVSLAKADLDRLTQSGETAQESAFFEVLQSKNLIASNKSLIPFMPITESDSPFLASLAKHRPEELFKAINLVNPPGFGNQENTELTPFEMKSTLSKRQASAAGYELEDAGVILKKTPSYSQEEEAVYLDGEDKNKTPFQAKVALRIDTGEERIFTIQFQDRGAKKQLKLPSSKLAKLRENDLHQLFNELSQPQEAEIMNEPFKNLQISSEPKHTPNQDSQKSSVRKEKSQIDKTHQHLSKPQIAPSQIIPKPKTFTSAHTRQSQKFQTINSSASPQSATQETPPPPPKPATGFTPRTRTSPNRTSVLQKATQSFFPQKKSNWAAAAGIGIGAFVPLAAATSIPFLATLLKLT